MTFFQTTSFDIWSSEKITISVKLRDRDLTSLEKLRTGLVIADLVPPKVTTK